jgi:hypothetical protein
VNTKEAEKVRKALENNGFTVRVQGYADDDDLTIFAWLSDDSGKMIANTCVMMLTHIEEERRQFLAFRLSTDVHNKVSSHKSIYDLVQHLLDIKKEFA